MLLLQEARPREGLQAPEGVAAAESRAMVLPSQNTVTRSNPLTRHCETHTNAFLWVMRMAESSSPPTTTMRGMSANTNNLVAQVIDRGCTDLREGLQNLDPQGSAAEERTEDLGCSTIERVLPHDEHVRRRKCFPCWLLTRVRREIHPVGTSTSCGSHRRRGVYCNESKRSHFKSRGCWKVKTSDTTKRT